jgi:hypothetical protein
MNEPPSTLVETPPSQSRFPRNGDREEESAQNACFVALFLQMALAIMVVLLTFMSSSRFTLTNNALHEFLVSLLTTVEFGGFVFLSHGWFTLPHSSSTRIATLVGSLLISVIHLAIVSTLGGINTPRVFSYLMVALAFYFASLWMTGWFFHRLFGASLSFDGQDVFQEAIGTKVLLLLSPFLVALGLAPIIGSMVLGNAMTVNSAVAIVFLSLAMLGVTAIPLATLYLFMVVVRMKGYARYIAAAAVMSIIGLAIIIDWTTTSWTLSILTGFVAAYVAGVGLEMAPFVWHGFWPVWAKRKCIEETERPVSFDDVI